MSNQRNKTFRLSLIRRRIVSLCQSRALRAALLAALNGGPDAALVVEMVERVRPPSRLPIQVVTPVPQQEEEEARVAEPVPPVQPVSQPRQGRPNQVAAPPQARSVVQPTQTEAPQATTSEGNSVIIVDSDSDSDFSD